jgi:DNA-directed RNA polymerase subunit N (RpoN/RPB10)
MYPFIKCPTCNNSLGEYADLYELLKNNIYEEELKKIYKDNYNPSQIEIDSLVNVKLTEIFELLHIQRYCCRRILITNVNYDSLLYSSVNN